MKQIRYEDTARWLDELAKTVRLVAPRDVQGSLLYRQVQGAGQIVMQSDRPTLSIKEAFLPPTERLFEITQDGNGVQVQATYPQEKQVLFGVRACDARGVRHLDQAFLHLGAQDPYYARRRANTTLIGLACEQMGPHCFCTAMGLAPDDPTDMDLMLYPVEGGYLLEAVSEKGDALLAEHPVKGHPYQQPRPRYIYRPAFETQLLPRERWQSHFHDEYWQSTAERCLSCRICAYVCPTCRCFDLRDEQLAGGNGKNAYERVRCWDACTGTPYRRIAGGHNSRPEKGQRLRNRFLCKFDYFGAQYGLDSPACTGCGRCIEACPVNIDISEVMEHILEVSA